LPAPTRVGRTTGSSVVVRPSTISERTSGAVDARSPRSISDLADPPSDDGLELIEPETRPALPALVRFSEETSPALEVPSLDGRLPGQILGQIPNTRPGHQPARAPRGSTSIPVAGVAPLADGYELDAPGPH